LFRGEGMPDAEQHGPVQCEAKEVLDADFVDTQILLVNQRDELCIRERFDQDKRDYYGYGITE
jgi:hypothetical protein